MPTVSRRSLLAAATAVPLLSTAAILRAAAPDLSRLRDMTGNSRPIDPTGRARRRACAQALMKANGI